MADATTRFFEQLGQRVHEPLLEKVTGTVRLDLWQGRQTSHWLVHIATGDLTVSRDYGEADCVARTSLTLFNQIATGEANGMAAILRGAVAAEGNLELLVLLNRLFPGRRLYAPEPDAHAGRPA